MATITKPMALDESFNTTESTPRNQADVLAGIEEAIRQGFGQVASAVEYDNTDSGLTADNVQDAIDELVEDKADTSEVTEVDTSNTTPFLYRQTPYNADGVFLDKLVGGSVAWNQLVQNGNFADTSGWSSGSATLSIANNEATVTMTGSAWNNDVKQNKVIPENHVVIMSAQVKMSSGLSNNRLAIEYTASTNKTFTTCGYSSTYTNLIGLNKTDLRTVALRVALFENGSSLSGQSFNVKNFYAVDLTQYFGSTIADYIYSLEQATAGSGIAWLKSHGFFTKDYYPYNTGELISVKTSGKKVVGKNLLPLTIANLKSINTSGTWNGNTYNIYGVNFTVNVDGKKIENITISGQSTAGIDFFLATNYTVKFDCLVNISANKNQSIGYADIYYGGKAIGSNNWQNGYFDVSSGTNGTVGLYLNSSFNDTVIVKPMIRLASVSDDTYEPYTETTYDISNIDLRGIPKLVNNELVYDGDTYESNGDVTRKYGIINLDETSATYNTGFACWVFANLEPAKFIDNYTYPNVVDSTGRSAVYFYYSFKSDNTVSINPNGEILVGNNSSETKPTGFVVYELATPTTETTDPYTNPQICDKDGTEEFIDDRTVPIPVGHNSRYADLPAIMDGDYLGYMVREIEKCAVDAEFMQFTDGTDTFTDVNLSLDASLHTVSVVGSKIEQKRFICFEVMDKMGGVLQGILASCIAFTDGAKTPSGTAFRAYIESLQMYVNFRIYGSGGSYTLAYQSETSFSASAFYVRVRMMNNL